jgi:hypothetical protein
METTESVKEAAIDLAQLELLDLLARIQPTKRRRLRMELCGGDTASATLLQNLIAEFAIPAPDRDAFLAPAFFAADLELDAIYAACVVAAAATENRSLFDDSRGLMEMDGSRIDALLAYKDAQGIVNVVLMYAKPNGKWSSRRSRRLVDRLRRIFGDDGKVFAGVRPRFVAFCPTRPGPVQTAQWPAWMKRNDGSAYWLSHSRGKDELKIIRCDKRGRPRRIGEFWKLG